MAALALTVAIGVASASHVGWHLFGDAQIVAGGNPDNAAQIRSGATAPGYGGVDFDIPAATTFATFTTLSTDYRFAAGSSCGGGSPRFQVNVETTGDDGNIFVYIGPPPNYTGCLPNVWANTGDLLDGVNLIDTSQLIGGNFYDPYAAALTKYGSYTVTGVQVVVDAGWMFPGGQTAFVDNTNIDGAIYTYDEQGHPTSKDDCKDGGWMDLVNNNGEPFKNQGDCVSYTNGN